MSSFYFESEIADLCKRQCLNDCICCLPKGRTKKTVSSEIVELCEISDQFLYMPVVFQNKRMN